MQKQNKSLKEMVLLSMQGNLMFSGVPELAEEDLENRQQHHLSPGSPTGREVRQPLLMLMTYYDVNDSAETTARVLWETAKAVMQGKITSYSSHRKKKKRFGIRIN